MAENKYRNYRFSIKIISSCILLIPLFFLSPGIIAPATIAYAATPTVPVLLSIKDAKVNAHVIAVGVTSQGNLDVPNNFTEVGWYKKGPKPGEEGSVVLDGHVDNGSVIPGPFKHLKELAVGDDIYVTMSDGSKLHYAVTSSNVYETSKFPSKKVFTEAGKKYLKIITCHGTYIPKINTYDHRLVVTAVLVDLV